MAIIGKQTKFQFPERAVSIVLFLIMATYGVAQFEALQYRPESRGIDSRCHWNCCLAYTVYPVHNGTAFIRQIFLYTLSILSSPPALDKAEVVCTGPRKRDWSPAMDNLSEARSHHFGCRWNASLLGPVSPSVGDCRCQIWWVGGRWITQSILNQQTIVHSWRSEWARWYATADSSCFGTARFRQGGFARTGVPWLLNNSDCSLWYLQG